MTVGGHCTLAFVVSISQGLQVSEVLYFGDSLEIGGSLAMIPGRGLACLLMRYAGKELI